MGLRQFLRQLKNNSEWYHGESWFYNLDNNRPDNQVERELRAIAAQGPDTIELCECIGNKLPKLKNYYLLRDTSSKSRMNIAAYVHTAYPKPKTRWLDMKETWSRTQGPGRHEPRSYLEFSLARIQKIVAHQPPKYTDNVMASQWEGYTRILRAMVPWKNKKQWRRRSMISRTYARLRPRMLMWDSNRRAGENGPAPDRLATVVGGKLWLGERIDNAITRNMKVRDATLIKSVGGIPLKSDHGHAIRVRWSVRNLWVPKLLRGV